MDLQIAVVSSTVLGVQEPWIKFLAGTGAIILTFLAGAELDPDVFRKKWKEATALGIAGFIAPFLGCAAVAHYWLGWDSRASWITGVTFSTTSVAVVYAVMLETGLNTTTFGKTLLAGCFINDLGSECYPDWISSARSCGNRLTGKPSRRKKL